MSVCWDELAGLIGNLAAQNLENQEEPNRLGRLRSLCVFSRGKRILERREVLRSDLETISPGTVSEMQRVRRNFEAFLMETEWFLAGNLAKPTGSA